LYPNSSTGINKSPRYFYGYVIVALSYVLSMLVFGVYNSFGVFFDPMLNDFGWSKGLTSGAFTVSTLVQGLAAILSGKITDRTGPRLVMTIGGFLLGVGYIIMAFISNSFQFYLVYGLIIGVGVGGFWVPLLSTISRWFSRKRGLMIGIFLTGAGAGTFILPPFINWLIQNYEWRQASAVIGIMIVVICVILPQFIKRDPGQIGQLPDGDISLQTQQENPDNKGFSLKEALETRQFWMVILIFFCCGWFAYVVIVHIVPYTIYAGIPSTTAANILAVSGIFSAVGSFVWGIAADKTGIRKVALTCFIILGVVLMWFLIFRSVWQLYLFGIIFGFAFGGVGVMEMLSVVWLFGLKANAFILAGVDLGFVCGAAFGPMVAGYIFDASGSYQDAFILCVVLSLIPILLTTFIKPKRQFTKESR